MEIYERIRDLRKNYLHLSQTEFANRLGVSRSVISNVELNVLAQPDQKLSLYKLICREFNIREEWLLHGEGEMQGPEEDEIAVVAAEILMKGRDDPLYDLIIDIARDYQQMSPSDRKVVQDAIARIRAKK